MTPSAPLRVAMVTRAIFPWHGVGGLERHCAHLVTHLLREGVAVTLIAPPPREPSAASSAAFGATAGLTLHPVLYRTFPGAGRAGTTVLDRSSAYPLFGLRAGRAAAALVARGAVDLVHGHGIAALGYLRARARDRSLGAPAVVNPHGLEEFKTPSAAKAIGYAPLKAAARYCARHADAVVATDRALRADLEKYLDVEPSRITELPNAIDLEECHRLAGRAEGVAARRELGLADGVPLLLSVGRLQRNKGYDVLARAIASARERLPAGWLWVLAGDGPEHAALADLIRRLRLDAQVRLAGAVSDRQVHAWYEAADLFVHPARYEGSSIVTLEAMAHGRAVVASRAGGLPDKVIDSRTGWLVAANNVEALADAIVDALSDRERRARFGRAGAELVSAEFDWPAVARRTMALYEGVLVRQRKR